MTQLLSITNLRKFYRTPDGHQDLIVNVPHLQIEAGQQIALHGSSGCGKTQTLADDIIFSAGSFIQWPEGKQD